MVPSQTEVSVSCQAASASHRLPMLAWGGLLLLPGSLSTVLPYPVVTILIAGTKELREGGLLLGHMMKSRPQELEEVSPAVSTESREVSLSVFPCCSQCRTAACGLLPPAFSEASHLR